MGESVEELVSRLRESVGPAVYEEGIDPPSLPEPRVSWVELQGAVVAASTRASAADRERLAAALLDAVLRQPSFGPSNRLDDAAFALILDAAPNALRAALGGNSVETTWGGRRYLHWHVWSLPGDHGAVWLGHLVEADDSSANFLFQDMCAGKTAPWREGDWPARLDVIATLPAEPRPGIVSMLFLGRPTADSSPALTRVVMAHAADERDPLLRFAAAHVRGLRTRKPEADDALFDWDAGRDRPDLFHWLLELAGEDGSRAALVGAAVGRGRISEGEGRLLASPLERPAWADGPVPWSLASVVAAGPVRVPEGRLTGGDPWWTGGREGLPWIVELPPGAYEATVVVASHPLAGRQCAALQLGVSGGEAVSWSLVRTVYGKPGYTVEVGVAGLGAVGAYDPPRIYDEPSQEEWITEAPPWWHELDAGDAGSLLMCSVGPQHQECRTWRGVDDEGRVVGVVTDLGLLDLDLESDPQLPWSGLTAEP
jgi:hypothetical protein